MLSIFTATKKKATPSSGVNVERSLEIANRNMDQLRAAYVAKAEELRLLKIKEKEQAELIEVMGAKLGRFGIR